MELQPADFEAPVPRRPRRQLNLFSLGLFGIAAVGVLQFRNARAEVTTAPFARLAAGEVESVPQATPSPSAYGKSGEVRVRFALPGEAVEYPLQVQGDPTHLAYQWVRLADSASADVARPLAGAALLAPQQPGFYKLALLRGEERRVVDGVTLSVLVPFSHKVGSSLNGYRIGFYLSERIRGKAERPEGFVQIEPSNVDLAITKHLRLSDFVTHDGQRTWPRYAAVSPLLLDKIELVLGEVAKMRGGGRVRIALDVHSGFRTPAHNRGVEGAARDSRHQYGDAADVTIDADGDGRYSAFDARLVALAVEQVERKYPELVGGMGIYTSSRFRTPYVHIDARGSKTRWRG